MSKNEYPAAQKMAAKIKHNSSRCEYRSTRLGSKKEENVYNPWIRSYSFCCLRIEVGLMYFSMTSINVLCFILGGK